MAKEYIEREALLAEIENEYKNVEKIKTSFAKIIVDGTAEKPYYSILWLDNKNKGYNVGYSSYCLDYVFKWLEVVFEFIPADEAPADVVEVPQEYAYYTDFDDENYLVHISVPISEKQFKAVGAGADLWEVLRGGEDG